VLKGRFTLFAFAGNTVRQEECPVSGTSRRREESKDPYGHLNLSPHGLQENLAKCGGLDGIAGLRLRRRSAASAQDDNLVSRDSDQSGGQDLSAAVMSGSTTKNSVPSVPLW
jgi:hypothetical protein